MNQMQTWEKDVKLKKSGKQNAELEQKAFITKTL